MAEAMELDLSLNQPRSQPLETPIVPPLKPVTNVALSNIPKEYTIHEYYSDDQLGSDVLKQKYLAPGETHPFELWQRQATALASVEKTKIQRDQWEERFYSILEDFKFVPGGRIMHGAGREAIPKRCACPPCGRSG